MAPDGGEGHDGVTYGAAIHDVEDAIDWVQRNADFYCVTYRGNPCWNHKIELVGNSSGGNLVYMASGRLGPGNPYQVNAIGAWSGALKFYKMSNGSWPCDPTESSKPANCSKGENVYLRCPMVSRYPDTPQCDTYYQDGGPNNHFSSNTLPRAFFSNGTPVPGSGGDEVSALQAALDFKTQLDNNMWNTGPGPAGYYKWCRLPFDLHAKEYMYNYSCVNETQSVYRSMVSFLAPAVG